MDLNQEQKDLLHKLYYDDKLLFGRDKVFQYVKQNHPEAGISRRSVQKWLDQQPVYQKTKPPPPKVRISAIAIDKPGYYTVDLSGNLPRDQGYNYYCGFIEVSTRKLFTRALKTKESTEVRDAVKDIIDSNDLKVTLCRSDNGLEFFAEFSTFLQERGIKQIYSDVASPWQNVIEKNLMFTSI